MSNAQADKLVNMANRMLTVSQATLDLLSENVIEFDDLVVSYSFMLKKTLDEVNKIKEATSEKS
jgi:hypothetical protein